jgi:hypothetical protein
MVEPHHPARGGLRKNHVELVAERAVADEVLELTVVCVDREPIHDRLARVDQCRHPNKAIIVIQPRVAINDTADAIGYLLLKGGE